MVRGPSSRIHLLRVRAYVAATAGIGPDCPLWIRKNPNPAATSWTTLPTRRRHRARETLVHAGQTRTGAGARAHWQGHEPGVKRGAGFTQQPRPGPHQLPRRTAGVEGASGRGAPRPGQAGTSPVPPRTIARGVWGPRARSGHATPGLIIARPNHSPRPQPRGNWFSPRARAPQPRGPTVPTAQRILKMLRYMHMSPFPPPQLRTPAGRGGRWPEWPRPGPDQPPQPAAEGRAYHMARHVLVAPARHAGGTPQSRARASHRLIRYTAASVRPQHLQYTR
jgi:hypothetical protein